ncbi:MAG: aspartate kinase [Sinomicrobium sp.]|nr:aspartate kinase [Sinomicrobium sp.]
MRVFKFGGASVKDARGVRNVVKVLRAVGHENTVIVVSAMGKTTRALETVVQHYFSNKAVLQESVREVKNYHNEILHDLFDSKDHPVFSMVDGFFAELNVFLDNNTSSDYHFVYDQIVCFGELIATAIVHHYLQKSGIENNWKDVRNCIKTDARYRDATVNWEATRKNILRHIAPSAVSVVQGFIGCDPYHFTTTLGKEGSDYTAAIFAYCLNAESVTIWKDVPGVLNADPRYFENPRLLHRISYTEAIELAFYGASVIHPKTLQPLQRKAIPLYVRSFLNPQENGTSVCNGPDLEPQTPCFILKQNQVLLSVSSLDFSFIMEDHISAIFKQLHHTGMKVDVIQNSAISFSVCIDNKFNRLEELLSWLRTAFKVDCYENVSLYTIRHATAAAIRQVEAGKTVLLRQSRKFSEQHTVQLVVK